LNRSGGLGADEQRNGECEKRQAQTDEEGHILRPVLRGAGLIKSSSQQSLILLIYSSLPLFM
jgi:hypothetical protein